MVVVMEEEMVEMMESGGLGGGDSLKTQPLGLVCYCHLLLLVGRRRKKMKEREKEREKGDGRPCHWRRPEVTRDGRKWPEAGGQSPKPKQFFRVQV